MAVFISGILLYSIFSFTSTSTFSSTLLVFCLFFACFLLALLFQTGAHQRSPAKALSLLHFIFGFIA
jgi:hypothetical protein